MKLQIRDDTGKTTTVPLTRDEVTIGRKEGNTIRLTERNVSRTHARLVRKGEEVHIEDLSRYGTRVNGERISETKRIADSDSVVIGDYTLQLEGSQPLEAPAPAEVPAAVAPKPPAAEPGGPTPLEKAAKSPSKKNTSEVTTLTAAMPDEPDVKPVSHGRGGGKKRIASNHPTLVVVTSQLAGTTYPLQGDTLILGRTGENDLQVEHHSISRNHAKIVIADGSVKMVDLQSKNGIRVNGEFWEESVLKSGDIVELGKVQFRYVEAGEDFVYRPEDYVGGATIPGTIEDEVVEKKKGGKGWLFLLLLLAAGGLAAFFILSQQESDVPNTGTTSQVNPATVAPTPETAGTPETRAAEVATKAPPVLAATKETSDPAAVEAKVIAEALAKAKSAMSAQKWADVDAQLEKVLALAPDHLEGKALRTRLIHEKAAQTSYDAALAAQASGDLEKAWTEVQKLDVLPDDSAFKARANELRNSVGGALANKLVDAGQVDIAAKRYDEAIAKGVAALEMQPNHPDAKGMMETAKKLKTVRRATPTTRKPPRPPRPPVKVDKPPVSTAKSGKDLYREAFDIHNTNPAGALKLYQQAASKRYAKAYKQMGSIYMKQGNTSAAKKAYSDYLRLNPGARDAETVKDIISRL